MSVSQTLVERNRTYAAAEHDASLRMMPSARTVVIACVDPRVDPERVLGAAPGELAVIRNVGGRVTPAVLDELVMLRAVTQAAGGDLGAGWEVVVLQHTDCGITRLTGRTAELTGYLGVAEDALAGCHVTDPTAAVVRDVELVRAETRLGAGLVVGGLVLDVATGLVDPV